MPRGPRLDYPNALHHVIIRGIQRSYIFDDDVDKALFLEFFAEALSRTGCICYGWCLMGNHGHFLVRSGPLGLAPLMRSGLTRYARWYNRSHRGRIGHVFHNRYGSSLCDVGTYFLNVLRYIHFNPLRARLVASLQGLATYAWTSHSALLGNERHEWLDTSYVLSCFGGEPRAALEGYLRFMVDGFREPGRLETDALFASYGGPARLFELRKEREKLLFDPRVLGSSIHVPVIQARKVCMTFKSFSKGRASIFLARG